MKLVWFIMTQCVDSISVPSFSSIKKFQLPGMTQPIRVKIMSNFNFTMCLSHITEFDFQWHPIPCEFFDIYSTEVYCKSQTVQDDSTISCYSFRIILQVST